MSFTYLNQLPTPAQIKEEFPLSEALRRIKAERDAEIGAVLKGESDKFLVIIGPCSADNETSSWTISTVWPESMSRRRTG